MWLELLVGGGNLGAADLKSLLATRDPAKAQPASYSCSAHSWAGCVTPGAALGLQLPQTRGQFTDWRRWCKLGSMGQFLGFLKQQAESCGLSTRKVQKSSNAATPEPQTHLGQDDTLFPLRYNLMMCSVMTSRGFLRMRLVVGGVVSRVTNYSKWTEKRLRGKKV